MAVNFNFIYRIALLTLLAFQVQSRMDLPTCEEYGGICVPEDSCDGLVSFAVCPGETDVCCKRARPDECSGNPVPLKCEAAYEGVCQRDCVDGRIETGSCGGDCKCCGCKISEECMKASGHCVSRDDACLGRVIPEWCAGKMCACCVPQFIEN
ncbi:uncharacterized protein [Palaemon carinicauda]|uniref:uncharacterized protein n=1 Tax=Palaemon carinicauda TaxID=392227 RepID=UPI0035B63E1D